jgi:hypothetical protein
MPCAFGVVNGMQRLSNAIAISGCPLHSLLTFGHVTTWYFHIHESFNHCSFPLFYGAQSTEPHSACVPATSTQTGWRKARHASAGWGIIGQGKKKKKNCSSLQTVGRGLT